MNKIYFLHKYWISVNNTGRLLNLKLWYSCDYKMFFFLNFFSKILSITVSYYIIVTIISPMSLLKIQIINTIKYIDDFENVSFLENTVFIRITNNAMF